MKKIWCVICFFIAGIAGLSAQRIAESTFAPAKNPLFNEDSLRHEAQVERERITLELANADIRYFVIRVPDEKFGYTIFIDGTMYIEQTSIPAVQGNAGFSMKESAEKVAKLVIEKIKSGEMPPTISMEELKQLEVIE